MKKLSSVILILVVSLAIYPQDKRYTKGAENGYMWIDYEKYSIMRDMKYGYLSSMLERQRIINLFQLSSDSLSCRQDIKKLLEMNGGNEMDLSLMVKKIDEFYSEEKLRIVPIVFAYCYCVKELAGNTRKELTEYLIKILKFSESEE